MNSLRLEIYSAVTRRVIKPWVRRQTDPAVLRQTFENHAKRTHVTPPHTIFRNGKLDQVPVLWVQCGQVQNDTVLFYIHGGGFVCGSPETHKHMMGVLCGTLGCEAVMPRYRLAPEHGFPSGFEDVCAAYLALLRSGRRPQDIVVGGDSAGGNLALALLGWLSDKGLQQPRCAFVLSPVVDFAEHRASMTENAKSETLLPADRVDELHRMYLQDHDPADPRISPVRAEFARCPPVLFHVSDGEILRDDTYDMQAMLEGKGHRVLVRSWPNAFHVFHIMYGHFPEAKVALMDVAAFVKSQMQHKTEPASV